VSGSGISWAICKSAPRSRQITMPAPYRSLFTDRMPFLLPNQQCQSTEGSTYYILILNIIGIFQSVTFFNPVHSCLDRLKIPACIWSMITILKHCSSHLMSCNCLDQNKRLTSSRSVILSPVLAYASHVHAGLIG